jgi:hypothetical protein
VFTIPPVCQPSVFAHNFNYVRTRQIDLKGGVSRIWRVEGVHMIPKCDLAGSTRLSGKAHLGTKYNCVRSRMPLATFCDLAQHDI